jgi:hypothetical protein
MITNDTIASSDINLLYMTDDPDEVIEIINNHREWKKAKIAESKET